MKESLIVIYYLQVKDRFAECGVNLLPYQERFQCNIKKADGLITFDNLKEAERFIRGYELGLRAISNDVYATDD